jgi:hypothetical protein
MSALILYATHRRANRPLEFRGLVGRYIVYGAALAVLSLIVFAVLYLSGLPPWFSLPIGLGIGAGGLARVYYLSNRYGEWGARKRALARRLPTVLRYSSRRVFICE